MGEGNPSSPRDPKFTFWDARLLLTVLSIYPSFSSSPFLSQPHEDVILLNGVPSFTSRNLPSAGPSPPVPPPPI